MLRDTHLCHEVSQSSLYGPSEKVTFGGSVDIPGLLCGAVIERQELRLVRGRCTDCAWPRVSPSIFVRGLTKIGPNTARSRTWLIRTFSSSQTSGSSGGTKSSVVPPVQLCWSGTENGAVQTSCYPSDQLSHHPRLSLCVLSQQASRSKEHRAFPHPKIGGIVLCPLVFD